VVSGKDEAYKKKLLRVVHRESFASKVDSDDNIDDLLTVATPLWLSVRMKLTLPKLGI
jgi:hypothetical protein